MKKKTFLSVLILLIFTAGFLCASGQSEAAEKSITLNFVTWDLITYDYMTNTNPIAELYKESHPNVEIIIEKSKDSETYEQTMQIRAAAGELPDIMPLKPYMLEKYKDLLLSLNDHPSTKINKFAEMYSIEGDIIGLPTASFNEFVYYRKSIFKELGLAVPETWGEFMSVLETIKDDGRFTPLLMGLKDAWPDYPFNEFMPYLESGDGNYYNAMAEMDAPFSPGKPFYESYARIQDMYDLNAMGYDPLGVGFDEVKVQFAAGKGVMMAAGQWFIGDYTNNLQGDIDDLGIFFLPVRDSKSETLYATVMADTFFGIPKDSKNTEAAKEFLSWYFDVYYAQILPDLGVSSTVEGIEVADSPVLAQIADLEQPEYILVEADGPAFSEVKNKIQFDVKKLGQEMSAGYYDSFDAMMDTLNKQWADAR